MTTVTLYGSPRKPLPNVSDNKKIDNVTNLYPLSYYSVQNTSFEEPLTVFDYTRSLKLRQEYENDGMLRTVRAVLLGHHNSIVHVFLLQSGSGSMLSWKLPGGKLFYGEDEVEGLKRIMAQDMGWEDTGDSICDTEHIVANWWRPNFENHIYPYIPAHITKPKELIKVILVELPKSATFTIPKNNILVAAPVFEIYNNEAEYGPIIANLPHALSRFNFIFKR